MLNVVQILYLDYKDQSCVRIRIITSIDYHNVVFCDGNCPYYRDFALETRRDRSHEILARARKTCACSLETLQLNCVQRAVRTAAVLVCRVCSNDCDFGSACGETVHSLFETVFRAGEASCGGQSTVGGAWSGEVSGENRVPRENNYDCVGGGGKSRVKIYAWVETDGLVVLTLFFVAVEQQP